MYVAYFAYMQQTAHRGIADNQIYMQTTDIREGSMKQKASTN